MQPLKNILVALDFSACSQDALYRADDLARRAGAELQVAHVAPTFGNDPLLPGDASQELTRFEQALHEKTLQEMQAVISTLPDQGKGVSCLYLDGDAPAPALLHHAENNETDLMVLGTHGRRGVKRWLLGSVTEEVLHAAPCSVLVVRQDKKQKLRPIRRVLVAVDFSKPSAKALDQARVLAGYYRAQLEVLHVVEPFAWPVSLTEIKNIYDLVPDFQEKVEARLRDFVTQGTTDTESLTTHIKNGHPAVAILDFIREQEIDLAVLATRGLTGMDRYFLGSVTARVARLASCPVYVVR